MKLKLTWLMTLFMAFVIQISFAQEKSVSGTITSANDGFPLAGVNVIVKGTTRGVQSDFDGNYTIKANVGETLEFSFVGLKKSSAVVGASNTINVKMEEDVESLQEVVIEVAYDVKRAKPVSNIAVTAVSAETIESRPNASVVQTLQGQVSGLNITTGSGQPGANSEINLRGVGSVTGSSEPLFIIDGVPVDQDNFRSLNQNEIASVAVLKDAGATAIYGNRGANGAVVITTRRGRYDSPLKIEYSGLTSMSRLQGNGYDLMNSTEQLQLERLKGTGRGAGLGDAEIAAIANYANTDWLDVFFRTSLTQSHTLSLTAGGENINSYTSIGYFNQDGILKASSLQRFNLRNNMNGKSTNGKFNYGTSLSLNYSKNNVPGSIGTGGVNQNLVLGAFQSVPYISPTQYTPGDGGSLVPQFVNTPLLLLDKLATYKRFEDEIKMIASLNANYKLAEGLVLGTRLSTDFTEIQFTASQDPNSFNSAYFAQPDQLTPGFQDQTSTRNISIDLVNSLTYATTFGEKHTVDFGIYNEYYKAHYRRFGYRANGLDPKTFYTGDGSGYVGDNADNDYYVDEAFANYNNAGLFSYFATADYDFDKKYGVGAVVRRDASYRFSESNRWGTFYAVSGRWNIDQEGFMENSVFGLLKLRGSYGTTGNQDISNTDGLFSDFAASDLFLNLYGTGTGYGGQNSLFNSQIANTDLKWESVTQANIGLDFEVFNRKLRGSVDFYKRETTDLYEFQPLASYTGTTGQFVNSDGKLINKGVDLQVSYSPFINSDGFNLTLNFVGNYNKSERYGSNQAGVEDGGPLGQQYLVRYAGVNPANGNLLFYTADGNVTEAPNEDTDRVFTGKTRYPDYLGSFGFEADYKGFFMTTQFNYALGVDRYDFDYSGFIDPNDIGSFRHSRDILNAWTPDNRITNIPSLNASNRDIAGDRFLQNADYIRLRFVSIGYNFSKKMLGNSGLTKLRLFVNGENLVTFTGWRGFDVEGFASTQFSYPTPRTAAVGLEIGF